MASRHDRRIPASRSSSSLDNARVTQNQNPPRSTSSLSLNADSEINWELPSHAKNFSKALRHTILERLSRCRDSPAALEALDGECRKVQRERWVRQQQQTATVRERQLDVSMNGTIGLPPLASSISRQDHARHVNEVDQRKSELASIRRFDMEVDYFVHVTRKEIPRKTIASRGNDARCAAPLVSILTALPSVTTAVARRQEVTRSPPASNSDSKSPRRKFTGSDHEATAFDATAAQHIRAREWSSQIVAVLWLSNAVVTTRSQASNALRGTVECLRASSGDEQRKSKALNFCWAHGSLPRGWQSLLNLGRVVISSSRGSSRGVGKRAPSNGNSASTWESWFVSIHTLRNQKNINSSFGDATPRMKGVGFGRAPQKRFEGATTPHGAVLNDSPNANADNLSNDSPGPYGWRLIRASVILKWAYVTSVRRVACERIVNMLRGARRMAKFHRAMHIFRRKLLQTQRAVRLHQQLTASRRSVLQLAWDRGLRDYVSLIERCVDPRGKVRSRIKLMREEVEKQQKIEAILAKPSPIDFAVSPPPAACERRGRVGGVTFPSLDMEQSDRSPAGRYYLDNDDQLATSNSFYFGKDVSTSFGDETFPAEDGNVLLFKTNQTNQAAFSDDATRAWVATRNRRPSAVVSPEVWRPLEFRRKSLQPNGDVAEVVTATTVTQQHKPELEGSEIDSHRSPTTSSLDGSEGSLVDNLTASMAARIELLLVVEELVEKIPERRVKNVLSRLSRFLHDANELHAAEYRSAWSVYCFDLEQAEKERAVYFQTLRSQTTARGMISAAAAKGAPPLPKPPSPRLVVAVPSRSVMLAFAKSEMDEHILRYFSTSSMAEGAPLRVLTMAPASTTVSPAAVLRNIRSALSATSTGTISYLPPMPKEATDQTGSFHRLERRIAQWYHQAEIERQRREEAEREVEPMPFPAVFRRDTLRKIV